MSELPSFAELATAPEATMDVLALALAAEFRQVHAAGAIATLDALGEELSYAAGRTTKAPEDLALACAQLLGVAHRFAGERERYDHPENSMLDLLLSRRGGLPILLSVVYIEVARRAGIALAGLPGHFVVGQFGTDPPLLLDPFAASRTVEADVAQELIRPWASPRDRCGCSTTSRRPTTDAATSPPQSVPPTCGWRSQPEDRSATPCKRNSGPYKRDSTDLQLTRGAQRSTIARRALRKRQHSLASEPVFPQWGERSDQFCFPDRSN
jgi:hypothetical protein